MKSTANALLIFSVGGVTALVLLIATSLPHDLRDAFIGSAAGAAAGALAAWLISVHVEQSKMAQEQAAALESAIAFLATTIEAYLNFKHQILLPTLERYRRQFAQFVRDDWAGLFAKTPIVVRVLVDLEAFPSVLVPSKALHEMIALKVRGGVDAIQVLTPLEQSIAEFQHQIDYRATIWQHHVNASDEAKGLAYFGLRHPAGNIDDRYPSNLTAMESVTNDCLYFSDLLMDILWHRYNGLVSKRGLERIIRQRPTVVGEMVALMPLSVDYPTWEQRFRRQKTRNIFGRLVDE